MILVNQLQVKDKKGNNLLNNISLRIPMGKIIGLTGPSGAGKTTLVNTILGILSEDLKVSSGTITIDDFDILAKDNIYSNNRNIAFIPQLPMISFDKRKKIKSQMVEIYIANLNINKSEALSIAKDKLKSVNLEHERVLDSYPTELSGGMIQRVILAISMGLNTDYIIADEPTSALDNYNSSLFFELIKANFKGKGILLITHDAEILKKYSDCIYVIENGCVIEKGSSKDIFENPKEEWTRKFVKCSQKILDSGGEWKWTK